MEEIPFKLPDAKLPETGAGQSLLIVTGSGIIGGMISCLWFVPTDPYLLDVQLVIHMLPGGLLGCSAGALLAIFMPGIKSGGIRRSDPISLDKSKAPALKEAIRTQRESN